MKIYSETSLINFDFWSGAIETAKYLTDSELETIENVLEEQYPDGMDETDVNDFFRFEEDYIAELLGYDDFETLIKERENAE